MVALRRLTRLPVRLFLADARTADRKTVEVEVREQMVSASEDENWTNGSGGVKVLILEHAMAAVRLGFVDFLNAFPTGNVRSKVTGRESIQTGTVHFLGSQVVPLVASLRGMQRFDADRLLRKFSPLLDSERASASEAERSDLVKVVRGAVARLSSLWESEAVVSLGHIVRCIHETGLLELPSELRDVLETQGELVEPLHGQPGLEDEEDPFLGAWKTAMDVEFDQFERYYNYAVGRSDLDTHQGVKGLEFQRVLVILDDSNARGFMFDYGKLFNASPLSDDDQKLIAAGEESTIDRTRRLLYVACSRAKNSLAVLLYSNDSEAAGATALGSGWFSEDEVVRL
jgi:DNA helicase-2/ATP-dependent DNA helicase PcrA